MLRKPWQRREADRDAESCLLGLLPAGANRRVGLAPTYLGHWCQAEIFRIADCIFAEVVDGVGMINGSFVIAANSGKCAGRPRFCHCGKDRINLSPVRSFGTVTIIPHS